MRVIGYLESSFWTMRSSEFASAMRVAYSHGSELDALLDFDMPKPSTMLARRGERLAGTRYVEMRGNVAVIDVNGMIAKRMDMFTELCYGGTSTEKLLQDFRTVVDDPNVASIVFNIDSPGGEAFGINEIAQTIYEARGKKPIKAYVSGLGCSGAYWIASAADEIITDKSSFLGSIGVVTAWMDDTEFYKMMGIRREVVTSSHAPLKRLNFDNDEHRAELQRELDSLEKIFHKAVARNRGTTVDTVINEYNKGGVYAGVDAVKHKMADRVGSLEGVIKELSSKKANAASASAGAEGDFDMSFRERFKNFAHDLGFNVQDETTAGETDDQQTPAADPPAPADEPAEPDAPAEATPESEEVPAESEAPAEDPAPVEADTPPVDAVAQLNAMRAEVIQTQAVAFVDSEIQAGRLFPSEKASCVSLYTKLASLEDQSPLAEFKSMQSARKPHGLTEEVVDADTNKVVLAGIADGGVITADRQKELLEKTHLGKAALKLVETA
jgi:signal peptide peptidase SppA